MTTLVRRLAGSTLLRHLIVALVAAALLFALTEGLSEFRNSQLANVALDFCAVAGLTVLTGLSGQISLGNGAFMFVGAYTVALLLEHHPFVHSVTGYGNGELVLVLIASALVAALVGALVGVAAARLRGPYLAGITIALALGLPVLPKYEHLQGPLGGHAGIVVNAPIAPGGVDFFRWQAWICCAAAVIVWFLLANLVDSRVGRAFRAVCDDEVAASLAGLSVARIQILAFVVSAAAAGLAGGLAAIVAGSVGPDSFGLTLSLALLTAAVLGGLGSLGGAAIGAVLIVFINPWATDVANALSLPSDVQNNLPNAVFGVVLIVAMLAFPFGLHGVGHRIWTAGRSRQQQRRTAAAG